MKHKFKCCNKTHLTIKLKEVNIIKWVEKKGKQKKKRKEQSKWTKKDKIKSRWEQKDVMKEEERKRLQKED